MAEVEDKCVAPPRRILSLDGGAQRGMAEVWFLEQLRQHHQVARWADHFDLIVGISFGAMVGACLALDDDGLLTDYFTHAKSQEIMHKGFIDQLFGEIQARPKYDGVAKTAMLRAKFANMTLGDLKIPFVTCTWNMNQARVKIWKSWEDTDAPLLAVLDAATAAPVFFPAVRVPLLPGLPGDFHIDGGVASNNPVIISKFCADDLFCEGELRILSVGTGSSHVRAIDENDTPDRWGVFQFLAHGLIDIVMNSTNQLTSILTRYNMADMFIRCEPNLSHIAFDDTSLTSWNNIRDVGIRLWNEHAGAVHHFLADAETRSETETRPGTTTSIRAATDTHQNLHPQPHQKREFLPRGPVASP